MSEFLVRKKEGCGRFDAIKSPATLFFLYKELAHTYGKEDLF